MQTPDEQIAPQGYLKWLGPAILLAMVVAFWLTTRVTVEHMDADVLIPIFGSLYRWQWFFWEQERYGQPLGLLVCWVRNPWLNLLLQNWLTALCGLLVFPLLGLLCGSARSAALAGAMAMAALALTAEPVFVESYLSVAQPYAVSLCAGILALLLWTSAEPRPAHAAYARLRIAAGAVLLFVCLWVNIVSVVTMLPLIVLLPRWSVRHRISRLPLQLELFALCTIVNFAITLWYPLTWREKAIVLGPKDWIPLLRLLAYNVAHSDAVKSYLAMAALGMAGTIAAVLWRSSGRVWRPGWIVVTCGLAAGGYALTVCMFQHTIINGCNQRYAVPTMVLLMGIAATLAAGGLLGRLSDRAAAACLGMLMLTTITGLGWRYGWPSSHAARATLDERFAERSAPLLSAGCTHLLGEYWEVWCIAFYANVQRYEAGDPRVIWPIASRCRPIEVFWRPALDGGTIGVLETPLSRKWWKFVGVLHNVYPLDLIERRPGIRLYRIADRNTASMDYRVPFGRSTTPYNEPDPQ